MAGSTLEAWKPPPSVTRADLQDFADSLDLESSVHASRYRILWTRHRLSPFDIGRALRLPGVRSGLAERILPEADVRRTDPVVCAVGKGIVPEWP